tara:strand:- start:1130 stop:1300 length:171 start_codon:yes stop_codon:yes gene_type:complete
MKAGHQTKFQEAQWFCAITKDYQEITFDAAIAYLSRFIPEKLSSRPAVERQEQNSR